MELSSESTGLRKYAPSGFFKFYFLIAGLVCIIFLPSLDAIITEAQHKQMSEGVDHYAQAFRDHNFNNEADKLIFMDGRRALLEYRDNFKIERIKGTRMFRILVIVSSSFAGIMFLLFFIDLFLNLNGERKYYLDVLWQIVLE